MWGAVRSFASTAWTYSAPVLQSLAVEGVTLLGSVVVGQNPKEDLAALKSKKNELDKKKAAYEKELQTKRKGLLEEQRDLDVEKKGLLREQENLKRAETKLACNKEVATDHKRGEKHLEKVREQLFQKLERYERDQNNLRERQEKNDSEYAEHRKRLEDAYETLEQNQSKIIHQLKTMPAVQKAKELHALTDNFMHNCEVFAEDPDAMVDKTKRMQSKYSHKLMEVRNVMREGHFFPGSMKVWADAALLDLHMLGFLVTKDVFSHRTVETAKDLYLEYWNQLKVAHSKHHPVTEGPDQLQAIEHLLVTQFRNFDKLMPKSMSSGVLLPALGPPQGDAFYSSSNRAFGATGDQFDLSRSRRQLGSVREGGTYRRPYAPEMARREDTGSSRDEDRVLILENELTALKMEMGRRYDCPTWDRSVQRNSALPSTRKLAVDSSSRGSAHHKFRTFQSDHRGKQRYSQDPQEFAAGRNHSRNKREPLEIEYQQDIHRSRNFARVPQQYGEGQYNSYGKQGNQSMHDYDVGEQEEKRTSARRNVRAGYQYSTQTYHEIPRPPDDHPESSEESISSRDEQNWDWREKIKPSRSSSRCSAVISSASSAGGPAHYLESTFESDPRGKPRYSRDPQECEAGRKHFENKRESQQNRLEPLPIEYQREFQGNRCTSHDQQQYHLGQYIPGADHENRGTHDHGGDQEWRKNRGRPRDRAGQQPSRQMYHERPHYPDERSESSSSDGHVDQQEDW